MPLFLLPWLLSLQPGASRSSEVAPAPALLARSPVCQEGEAGARGLPHGGGLPARHVCEDQTSILCSH